MSPGTDCQLPRKKSRRGSTEKGRRRRAAPVGSVNGVTLTDASGSEPEEAPSLAPPNPPWQPLDRSSPALGYLSVYLSDPLARYPVRAITKLNDNKSDPNIETLTYGLFSTCEPMMRQSIVNRGIPYVFFVTRRENVGRVLTGYYDIGWQASGALAPTIQDYALAAAGCRFIDPIPVADVPDELGDELRRRFRCYMGVSAEHTDALRNLIDGRPDRTSGYLAEIARLERFSANVTGYVYPTWGREHGFGWGDAARYLRPMTDALAPEAADNTSPSSRWLCTACQETIVNIARLKVCPRCREPGTLVPTPSTPS